MCSQYYCLIVPTWAGMITKSTLTRNYVYTVMYHFAWADQRPVQGNVSYIALQPGQYKYCLGRNQGNIYCPLKTYWFEIYRHYLFDNPGCVITKFQFSSLFAQA